MTLITSLTILSLIIQMLESEKSISNTWIEFDRKEFEDDKNFITIIDYLKENDL